MTKEAVTPDYYRVKISGTLICKTNLHIGDGTDAIMEDERKQHPNNTHQLKNFEENEDKRPHYNRFVRNAKGELYAPASTLRGSLRQSPVASETLFGKKDTSQDNQQQGGKVRIYDAKITMPDPDKVKPLAYWHSKDQTGLHAGVVINAQKGVAEHGKLFQHEVIPAGSQIHFKAEIDFATEDDLTNLLETLKWWNGDLMSAMAARKSKAWGLVQWKKKLKIKKQDFTAMSNWLIDGGEKPKWSKTKCKLAITNNTNNFTLVCQQPLLVNEPGQIKKKRKDNNKTRPKDEHLPDQIMYRQANGKYAIPSQTTIGTLRSIARRIMLTQLNLNGWDDSHNQTADDFIESIFGNTQGISQVRCSNLETEETELHTQYFIAIDRFTGGVVEGKLYITEALPPQTTLGGQLLINENLSEEQKGLLYLSLRELKNGAWIGWGKSKGYGLVTLQETTIYTLLNLKEDEIQNTINTLSTHINNNTEKAELTKQNDDKITSSVEPQTSEKNKTELNKEIFYNPYSFIPLNNKWTGERPQTPQKAMLDKSNPADNHARHDLYLPNCHSGIIRCNLTTVTDTLVGNQHEDRIVQPYRHNGKVAFPANSLRGMIGTTIEALSASSLRVLEDNKLSVTAGFGADKEKGRLIRQDEKYIIKKLKFYPIRGNFKDLIKNKEKTVWFKPNNPKEYSFTKEKDWEKGILQKNHNFEIEFITGEQFNVTKEAIEHARICNSGADIQLNVEEPENQQVWYKTNTSNEVIELSSTLRKPWIEDVTPDKSTTYQVFKDTGFENLLPWGETERDWLHPAELMLGIIEEQKDNSQQISLASRLRFTDALSTNEDQTPKQVETGENTILLKILASPKQPSEYMYYHKNEDGKLIPNGRKQYLRQHPDRVNKDSYRSRNHHLHLEQKIRCNPIKKDQNFSFDIHFHNLKDQELSLLIKAIKPSNNFYHKLGLGKPLGLGTIKVAIKHIKTQPTNYYQNNQEREELSPDKWPTTEELIDTNADALLQEIGKLQSTEKLITYPLSSLQNEIYHANKSTRALAEEELFKWFTKNKKHIFDGKRTKALRPIIAPGNIYKGTLQNENNVYSFQYQKKGQMKYANLSEAKTPSSQNTKEIAQKQLPESGTVVAYAQIDGKNTVTMLATSKTTNRNSTSKKKHHTTPVSNHQTHTETTKSGRQKGIINNYISHKGFGFITPESGGENVFFHFTDINSSETPEKDQQIEYDLGNNKKGICAKNIIILK